MAAWASMPACSKSLFVRSPAAFAVDTIRHWTSSGKRVRHKTGGFLGAKSTPPPHTGLGSVNTANHRWVVGHDLREACGMVCNVPGKGFEVCQVCPQVRVDPDAMFVGMGEPQLKGPKETGGSRDCWSHDSELP